MTDFAPCLSSFQAKENADELVQEKTALEKAKKEILESAAEKEKVMITKLKTVGNYIHDSVPVSNTEDDNPTVRTWVPEGVTIAKDGALSHHEVLVRIDGYNPEAGVKVVGHRGYFLRGIGVRLNQAIINYGLDFLSKRGYVEVQPPYMMLKEVMASTGRSSPSPPCVAMLADSVCSP